MPDIPRPTTLRPIMKSISPLHTWFGKASETSRTSVMLERHSISAPNARVANTAQAGGRMIFRLSGASGAT